MVQLEEIISAGIWDKPRTCRIVQQSILEAYRRAGGIGEPRVFVLYCTDAGHFRKPHYHISITGNKKKLVLENIPKPKVGRRSRGRRNK
jgi:hypothetical protein